jgi:hypothetical protein
MEFAEKHKGSIDKWVFKRHGEGFDSARPVPRCPTSQSMANYNHGKNGTVKALLNGEATPRPESAPPCRIKSEGEPIASMLSAIGQKSVDDVVSKTVPSDILFGNRMDVDQGMK